MLNPIQAYRQETDANPGDISDPAPPRLTPREVQVMSLLANGKTVKQTARELGVSRRNIVRLLASARDRLGAQTRDQAISRAVALCLIVVK